MNKTVHRFRFADILIILLCLSTAAISLNLFRLDMFQTINSRNDQKPIGSIFIKDNNVQRRLGDRVLWGRLAVESPVYPGDLVRVAESSAATLDINDTHINLNENTLIRVQPAPDGKGPVEIELSQGSMDLSTSSGGGITLNVMGKQVRVAPGTVLNASSGENGMVVQVSEGRATVVEQGPGKTQEAPRELAAGTMVATDTAGEEKKDPALVVTQPRPNARYLNNGTELLNVDFAWNRINLDAHEALRLEIAKNRNFSTITQVTSVDEDNTQVDLEAGLSYWRVSYNDTALSSGQITVADSSGPALINPAGDQLFSFQTEKPQIRFLWAEKPEAVNYILEVSGTPDFLSPLIHQETATTSFSDSSLGPGTWYWRVMPVFLPVYEGSAAYSPAASFRIEQSSIVEEPAWPEPAAPLEPVQDTPEEVPAEIPAPVPEVVVPALPPPTPVAPPPVTPPPQPPPLLSEPASRLPPDGYRIGIEELRTKRSIDFKWSAVPGANAYIFTLYQQSPGEKRQIISTTIENATGWTLDNISVLERGTFIWQVEAVERNQNGTIKRQGRTGENSFVLDIPIPGPPSVQVEEEPEISHDE